MQDPTAHTDSALEGLSQLDQDNAPERILLCAAQLNPSLAAYCQQEGIALTHCTHQDELEDLGRFDAALVVDWLEHASNAEGTQLLARLRNLHSPHIWLMLKDCEHWHMNQLLALGFRRQHQQLIDGTPASSYLYRLESYNHKRSWNSPKHWANPQNWGKYWW